MPETTVLDAVKGCADLPQGWLRTIRLTPKEAAWLFAEMVDDDIITAETPFMDSGQCRFWVDGRKVRVTW